MRLHLSCTKPQIGHTLPPWSPGGWSTNWGHDCAHRPYRTCSIGPRWAPRWELRCQLACCTRRRFPLTRQDSRSIHCHTGYRSSSRTPRPLTNCHSRHSPCHTTRPPGGGRRSPIRRWGSGKPRGTGRSRGPPGAVPERPPRRENRRRSQLSNEASVLAVPALSSGSNGPFAAPHLPPRTEASRLSTFGLRVGMAFGYAAANPRPAPTAPAGEGAGWGWVRRVRAHAGDVEEPAAMRAQWPQPRLGWQHRRVPRLQRL